MCFSNLFFVLFILCCYVLKIGISKDGNFTLGFFTPQNSTNRYVGIWWKSHSTVIWVAIRNQPLNDSSGIVTISEDGNLVVLNGQKRVIWSSNMSTTSSSNTSAQLLDSGKLVLAETTTVNVLWDSFQQPSNTLLPGLKLSHNIRTGTKVELTSWKSPSNPSLGSFSLGVVERMDIVEVFIWNETRPYWRSGPWNGGIFTGIPNMTYLNGFKGGDDGQGNIDIYYTKPSTSEFVIYMLNSQGKYDLRLWDDLKKEMKVMWTSQESDCDVYGICGPFTSCNAQNSPICSCLKGFEPRNKQEWDRQNCWNFKGSL